MGIRRNRRLQDPMRGFPAEESPEIGPNALTARLRGS